MTARFWFWWNDSPVRLSLRDGQTLRFEAFHRHEEGWHSESVELARHGDTLYREHNTDGRDCDGRMSTSWQGEARLDRLDGVRCGRQENYPDWTETDSSQRDYSAEAAGY